VGRDPALAVAVAVAVAVLSVASRVFIVVAPSFVEDGI
jgi:hypothetical protein